MKSNRGINTICGGALLRGKHERTDCHLDVRWSGRLVARVRTRGAALDCAPGKFSNAIIPTYKENHPDTVHVTKDARETSADELLDAAELSRGEVDVIDGSPPCSPFSGANTKKAWGDHESGTLFDRYTHYIEEIQPRTFVAENVPDLAQGKTKGYYKRLCENLRGAGYNLQVQQIDAAYLGAPHHRRRLMFIGVREDIGTPPTIDPTSQPTTVREAYDGVENSPEGVAKARNRLERSKVYEKYLEMDPGQSLNDVMSKPYGFCHHRLHWRKPAPTMPVGGGSTSNKMLHPDDDRGSTIAEYKRLTGLPDEYIVPDSFGNAKECIVRCLPPVMLETIGDELLRTVL